MNPPSRSVPTLEERFQFVLRPNEPPYSQILSVTYSCVLVLLAEVLQPLSGELHRCVRPARQKRRRPPSLYNKL